MNRHMQRKHPRWVWLGGGAQLPARVTVHMSLHPLASPPSARAGLGLQASGLESFEHPQGLPGVKELGSS